MAPGVMVTRGAMRLEGFDELRLVRCLEHYGLVVAYSWFASHNTAANHPYHNNYHGLRVMLNCVDGLTEEPLSFQESQELLLAAIFHDGDHSGGVVPDCENIRAALALLKKAVDEGVVPALLHEGAATLIEATQHPYVREALTVSERILRDADLMNCLGDSWFEHIFVGLRHELEHKLGPLTLRSFCAMQEPFFASLEFTSKWGQARKAGYIHQARVNLATALQVCDAVDQRELDDLAAFKAVTEVH